MSSEIYYAAVSYRASELRQAVEQQRRIREAVGAARARGDQQPGGEGSGSRSRGRRSRRRQSAVAACGC